MMAGGRTSPLVLPRPGMRVLALAMLVRHAPTRWKFQDRSILLRKRIAPAAPAVLPPGHSWVWAGPAEIGAIDAHAEATSRSAYARRLARGDACLCLKRGEQIVGYRWIAWHSGCLYCGFGPRQELRFLPLKPTQAFLYDLYVYSAERRHGYGAMLFQRTFDVLRERGIQEAFALVDPANHAVIRLDLRLGFEAVCMAYAFRIRQWHTMLFGPETDAPAINAWMAQLAGSHAAPGATAQVACS